MQIINGALAKTTIILFSFILFISFSTNPPKGKTGAPGESFCTECHNPSSGSIDGNIMVEGLPSLVNPGETYSLTLTNTYTKGTPTRSGFQMVVLDPDNKNSGSFSNAVAGTTIANSGGRTYWDHSPAKQFGIDTSVSWTVDWQAPDAPLGDSISFYAAAMLGNGSGSSGDKALRFSTKVRLDIPSSVTQEDLELDYTIYPNPADAYLTINNNANIDLDNISLYSLNGAKVMDNGNNKTVDTGNLENGMYILIVRSQNHQHSQKVLISH